VAAVRRSIGIRRWVGKGSTRWSTKTLAAAVLARDLGAELLLILTDVDAVYADWGTPNQRPLTRLTIDDALEMDRNKAFGEGSMARKFGRQSILSGARMAGRSLPSLDSGQMAVHGEAGTTITAMETA
jgi:carbamate kinase